jgi:formate hydrogenlyase subunit 3/multisubunit Na+/H+ antiporter MnhD subunit
MYFKDSAEADGTEFSPYFKWAMVLNAILIIVLGIHPDLILNLI